MVVLGVVEVVVRFPLLVFFYLEFNFIFSLGKSLTLPGTTILSVKTPGTTILS